MLGPTEATCVEGIAREICHLLSEVLTVKIRKLARLSLPRVLLIFDQYGFGSYGLKNPRVRGLCVSGLPELANFHTVFIVEDNDEGFVLSSQDGQWADSCEGNKPLANVRREKSAFGENSSSA